MTSNDEIKMTNEEIKKALECCINEDRYLFNCKDCVFIERKLGKGRECTYYMLKSALDLINQYEEKIKKCEKVEHFADKTIATLQAENERLGKEVDRLSQVVMYNDGITEMKVDEAKAEAIKEFAELLKNDWIGNMYYCEDLDITDWIDNLLKEMGVE